MMHFTSNNSKANVVGRLGSQPIALAAAALVILVIGVGSIVTWRAYTGTSPEQDRTASARQLQARTAQASEQLIEKTKGLETSQAGVDRPAASCSGSVADREAASYRAAS